jgi:hypothetical protein
MLFPDVFEILLLASGISLDYAREPFHVRMVPTRGQAHRTQLHDRAVREVHGFIEHNHTVFHVSSMRHRLVLLEASIISLEKDTVHSEED